MTDLVRDLRIWIAAGGVLVASTVCSALIARSVPVLYVHWIIKPILGIANAPTDEGFLGTCGVIARLLHSGIVVAAATAGFWLASRVSRTMRSGWFMVGLGLFIGGAAANAYQLLVTGSVLDWMTVRPLAAIGLNDGYPTYSLGDAAVASGIAVLSCSVLIKSKHTKARP